jgi:hypothetical protein
MLIALRDLRTSNPTLHAALSQTIELSEEADNDDGDDLFHGTDVYDDCDVPLAVISDHLLSGGSLAPNFAAGAEGGITRCGDAEASDAEQEELEAEPAVLGRDQRHKIAACTLVWQWDLSAIADERSGDDI